MAARTSDVVVVRNQSAFALRESRFSTLRTADFASRESPKLHDAITVVLHVTRYTGCLLLARVFGVVNPGCVLTLSLISDFRGSFTQWPFIDYQTKPGFISSS